MVMNIKDKTLRRALLVVAAVLVLLCVAAVHVMYRISRNSDGICATEGRVLSDEELRRRVIENIVKHEIDVVHAHDNAVLKAGIVPEISEATLIQMIDRSYHNEKSFEENFSVEVVSPRSKSNRFDVSALKDPFMLVVYDDSGADLYPMVSVQRELISVREIDNRFGLAESYLGFGSNFFKISIVMSLPRYCCHKNPGRLSGEQFVLERMLGYQDWLDSGRKLSISRRLMAVSTCGDVLVRPDDQNYRTLGTYTIDFLRRK